MGSFTREGVGRMIGNLVVGLIGAYVRELTGARVGGSMGTKRGSLSGSGVGLIGASVGAPRKLMVTLT